MTEWSSESSSSWEKWMEKPCGVFFPSRLCHSYLVRWALSLNSYKGKGGLGGRESQPSIPSIGGGANDPWVLM